MSKWIVFKATGDEQGWEARQFAHSGSLTNILCEQLDCSQRQIPEVGDRPLEFIRVENGTSVNPLVPAEKTHYRLSDWEIAKVETYEHEVGSPYAEYDMIVICHCKYNPVNAPLHPMPERQVSIASFGGDREAYERWLETQKQPVEV